jgi:hypothetical protein
MVGSEEMKNLFFSQIWKVLWMRIIIIGAGCSARAFIILWFSNSIITKNNILCCEAGEVCIRCEKISVYMFLC